MTAERATSLLVQAAQWLRAAEKVLARLHDQRGTPEDADARAAELLDLARHLDRAQLQALAAWAERVRFGTISRRERVMGQLHAFLAAAPPPPPIRIGAMFRAPELADGVILWLRSGWEAHQPVGLVAPDRAVVNIAGCLRSAFHRVGLELAPPADLVARAARVAFEHPLHWESGVEGLARCAGESVDLAVAVHLWMELVGASRPLQVAVTGTVDASGRVGQVDDVSLKIQGAVEEHPDLDLVVAPPGTLALLGLSPSDPRVGGVPVREVYTFGELVEALGGIPGSAELGALAARADLRRERDPEQRRIVVALLDRQLREQVEAGTPDRGWAEAMVWRARLSEGGVDPTWQWPAVFSALQEQLGETGHPGVATTPGTLADAAAAWVEAEIDQVRWDDLPVTLAKVGAAARVHLPSAPGGEWLRAVWAPELSRLRATIGHALLSLDALDAADRELDEALALAGAGERGRCHLHRARVALRRAVRRDGWSSDQLEEVARRLRPAHEALPSARRASPLDRTAVNFDLVCYRLETERAAAAAAAGGPPLRFARARVSPGTPVHDHDRTVLLFAELRAAWLAGDGAAFDERREAFRMSACLPVDVLLLVAFDLLSTCDPTSTATVTRAELHARTSGAMLSGASLPPLAEPALRAHPALAPEVVAIRDLWRLPALL